MPLGTFLAHASFDPLGNHLDLSYSFLYSSLPHSLLHCQNLAAALLNLLALLFRLLPRLLPAIDQLVLVLGALTLS